MELESAAADGKLALEVTGEDVAAYCDARLGDTNPYGGYKDKLRRSLNRDVKKQL